MNLEQQMELKTELYYEFKAWVENTKLFNVIREETNQRGLFSNRSSFMPTIVSREITLSLKPGVVISKMEDLPEELLREFFINSPFYHTFDKVNRHNQDSQGLVSDSSV